MWICKKDHDGLVKRIDIKEEIIKEYAARNDFYKKEFERVEKELLRTRRELWALEKEREKELGLTNHFLIREAKENKELEKELEGTRELVKSQQREIEEYRKTLKNVSKYNESELLKQELKEAYETISQLEKEKDGFRQDAVNIYGRMIDLNKEKKGLEKELKDAYETISQLEKERKDIEKENEQLKERNKEQTEIIVKQMRKLQKQETPDPLNGETLGAFYE